MYIVIDLFLGRIKIPVGHPTPTSRQLYIGSELFATLTIFAIVAAVLRKAVAD